jgi:starch-binding outer membrane protein, SusD/RagB family
MTLKYIITAGLLLSLGCTKLNQKLNDSFTTPGGTGSSDVNALLVGTYNSMTGLMHAQDRLFSLQETVTDEALIPVRGGDWDDNGVWRVLHAHTWTTIHTHIKSVFNLLGQLESGAITTLAFNPNTAQRAEALFLRSLAQFYFLDLYGQVPYRPISEYNAIGPAPVMTPAEAVDTLTTVLRSIIPQLPDANWPNRANPDAARFLLMKVLLNKGAFLNRQAPTFDNADMQEVITLGNAIMGNSRYSLTPNYFDNFGPSNSTLSRERIFAWPNTGSATNVDGINTGDVRARWMMTLHYNSWDQNNLYGSAGWNGFTTVADFYNTFGSTDTRLGGVAYPGVTDQSGLKPGLVVGQQFNQKGDSIKDRQGNPLAFTPDVKLIETDKKRLEVAGIRVIKYPPDYAAYNSGNQKNQLQIFRYADVVLMVAEARLRQSSPDVGGALTLVNQLRLARGATQLAAITLSNPDNVYEPNTLLAERGRELYFESWRRQDLIRFNMFLKPWALKDADTDPQRNLLFPIAPDELLANPNLKQNPGYGE